jgi:hypothetical protein
MMAAFSTAMPRLDPGIHDATLQIITWQMSEQET